MSTRRNRSLGGFTLLAGARDRAIVSLKLKHVDLIAGCINQDAREVKTKFSKTFTTFFFPATLVALGPGRQFEAEGLSRKHWSNASPIRTIFREAFASSGLPYFNPHSFRNTLVQLGARRSARPRNSLRHGARTWDMRKF
jgi:integrase